MATTLVHVSTSQIDAYDLVTGRIRHARNRQFVNNCVLIPWNAQSLLVTGFDSPDGLCLLLHYSSLRTESAGQLLVPRKFHSGVLFRKKAFVMGGYTHELEKLRKCESFDGKEWRMEAEMCECRSGMSSVATWTAIFVLGDNTSRSIEKFDGNFWRKLSFSLLYDTQNLAIFPTSSGDLMVIGGGSAATGATDAVRMQETQSETCFLAEKLQVCDYFRTFPVVYQ